MKCLNVRIRGKWWLLKFTRLKGMVGECDWKRRRIRIDPRETGTEALDTLIHESLHGLFPKLSERRIARTSRELTAILEACGYRKTERLETRD